MPTSVDISNYDQSGYDYRQYWTHRQYDDAVERYIISHLLPNFGDALADIGGGYGRLIDVYQPRFKHAVLVDYSKKHIQHAQTKIETNNYANITAQQGDVYQLPFNDESFSHVLLLRVIHHLERPSLALHEINRILSTDGILILQFANKTHLKNRLRARFAKQPTRVDTKPTNLSTDGIFYQFHPDYIQEKLKENGFTVERMISASNLRVPVLYRLLPSSLLLWVDRLVSPLFNKYLWGPSIFVVAKKVER